ncbi:MAG: hypothetical protein R2830_18550 [Saprospiraceae bacterium]
MAEKHFLQFASVAALLTVLTTIGIHFIDIPAASLEERMMLHRNPLYIFQKWMIIFHCIMVIVSMYGVAVLKFNENKGLISLGALFFAVFGITEISRMLAVLGYVNGLREKYLSATDEAARQLYQYSYENFSLVSLTMFLVFVLAFSLGNLLYGLALSAGKGYDRWLGYGLLFWGLLTLLAFCNTFWEIGAIDQIVEANNKFFQPTIRLAIGVWLWQKCKVIE